MTITHHRCNQQSLATFIIVSYGLLTQAIRSLQSAYNYWAILALEIFAIIFWLATMALLASTRAAFIYPAYISGCYNDGYGGYCYAKRDTYVATNGYLNMMSAAAGFSAIELFVAQFLTPTKTVLLLLS